MGAGRRLRRAAGGRRRRVDGRGAAPADRLARGRGGAAVTAPADLLAAATVGLAQRPLEITDLPGPAGAHLHVLAAEPATALLEAAALLDAARRAGGLTPEPLALPPEAAED